VASDAEMPGTAVPEGTAAVPQDPAAVPEDPAASTGRSRPPKEGRLPVSEMAADRSGALSPFGDDQTFPLPVKDLTYVPTIAS
jgi:hypothetical protein